MQKMRIPRPGVLLVAFMISAVLAACGDAQDQTSDSEPVTTSAETTATTGSGGETIYNLQNFVHPYIEAVNSGVDPTGEDLGLSVTYVNANGDAAAQISHVDIAISSGAAGIIIQPVDSLAIMPAIDRAVAAGLCVAAIAVPIGPDTGVVYPGTKAFVGWNETVSGGLVAAALAAEIGQSGKVAIIAADLGNGATAARVEGLEEEWAKYPGIEVLPVQQHKFDPNAARSMALSLVSLHGDDLKAIFVDTNPAAVTVANALEGTGVAIGSIGGMGIYHDAIASGAATVDVPEAPRSYGEEAVKLVNDCIQGDREPVFLSVQNLPALEPLKDDNTTITAENLDKFDPEW